MEWTAGADIQHGMMVFTDEDGRISATYRGDAPIGVARRFIRAGEVINNEPDGALATYGIAVSAATEPAPVLSAAEDLTAFAGALATHAAELLTDLRAGIAERIRAEVREEFMSAPEPAVVPVAALPVPPPRAVYALLRSEPVTNGRMWIAPAGTTDDDGPAWVEVTTVPPGSHTGGGGE